MSISIGPSSILGKPAFTREPFSWLTAPERPALDVYIARCACGMMAAAWLTEQSDEAITTLIAAGWYIEDNNVRCPEHALLKGES